jgi:hypothetical protein
MALPPDVHTFHTLIPAFNDLSAANHKFERLPAIDGAVKFLPVCQPSGVVHYDSLSWQWARSFTLSYVLKF